MLRNRSVPTDVVLPHIIYENVAEALAWLTKGSLISTRTRARHPQGNPAGNRALAWELQLLASASVAQ
jgi:hypothetical protein